MTRYISFAVLLVTIIFLVILFYKVMAGFLIPLFLAALLVVIFRPLHAWILKKLKGREKTAALATTAGILLLVLAPLAFLFVLAGAEARQLVKDFDANTILATVNQKRDELIPNIPDDLRDLEVNFENLNQLYTEEEIVTDHKGDLRLIQDESQRLIKVFEEDFDPTAGSTETDWALYWQSIGELKTYHEQLIEHHSLGEAGDPDSPHSFEGYRTRLTNTIQLFNTAKENQYGGKIWLGIVERLNPSDKTLEEYNDALVGFVQDKLVSISTSTGSFLGQLIIGGAIMVISLYFFLLDGPAMIESVKGLSPLDDAHEEELVVEFGNVSRAVVVATLLSALAQGLLGGIGYYFAGLESIFLLTLMTGCLALVPFVGAAAIWVPCSLYLFFYEGNMVAAIGLAIYGAAVISMADNLIKPLILHGKSNLHPLLALLSVLGGVTSLGPIGILIGPMIVAFLQTLLKILQRELSTMDLQSSSP